MTPAAQGQIIDGRLILCHAQKTLPGSPEGLPARYAKPNGGVGGREPVKTVLIKVDRSTGAFINTSRRLAWNLPTLQSGVSRSASSPEALTTCLLDPWPWGAMLKGGRLR